jgi:hypothetical protein
MVTGGSGSLEGYVCFKSKEVRIKLFSMNIGLVTNDVFFR